MSREERGAGRLGLLALTWAGIRRSPWQAGLSLLAGLLAAGSLVLALGLLSAMQQLLAQGMAALGGDLIVAPADHREAAAAWLLEGRLGEPLPATVDVADWRRRIEEAGVLGLVEVRGIDLSAGGMGEPAEVAASLVVIRLEPWSSPLMAEIEIREAIPDAAVLLGEQSTRHVLTDLQPLVRHLTTAAGVALLGAVAVTGLLASIRVGERRMELGMLRAMGAPRSFIVGLTLSESLALALAGGLPGLLLGAGGLSLPAAGRLLPFLSPVRLLGLASAAVAALMLATALAALGPALQAAQADPVESVRKYR